MTPIRHEAQGLIVKRNKNYNTQTCTSGSFHHQGSSLKIWKEEHGLGHGQQIVPIAWACEYSDGLGTPPLCWWCVKIPAEHLAWRIHGIALFLTTLIKEQAKTFNQTGFIFLKQNILNWTVKVGSLQGMTQTYWKTVAWQEHYIQDLMHLPWKTPDLRTVAWKQEQGFLWKILWIHQWHTSKPDY